MSYFTEDTIAAIASGANVASAIGVVRVSGKNAWDVCAKILRSSSGKVFRRESIASHKLKRCLVCEQDGTPLDDGMFVWMKGPHSFTGEDVVELHLHGSPYLLKRVMKEVLASGSREALPGEFSFRAFRNGRISLDQAESISDLIKGESQESSRRALNQLLGKGRSEIHELNNLLRDRLAEIEVDIDFSDQGLSILNYALWTEKLNAWISRVEKIRKEFVESQPVREGVRLAIVGAPNSGKSSLFNSLMGENRSIVSAQAGTTRDVVRESLYLDGVLFRISDTAGIRESTDAVEAEGILRSFGELSSAQAVVWVFDGSAELVNLGKVWKELEAHLPEGAKVLAVWNKADRAPEVDQRWKEFFSSRGVGTLVISALSGDGVDQLKAAMASLFQKSAAGGPDFLLSRWRHYEVLGTAVKAVRAAIDKVERGEKFPDLLANDLRAAMTSLGEITGEFSSEDLLNHIFAEFCIGK